MVLPRHEIELRIGEGEAVQALDIALPLSRLGERAELTADPGLAYGEVGLEESGLPPNAAVVIEYEVLEAGRPRDLAEMSVQERRAVGERKKERGNWWYQRGDPHHAIQCYK